VKPHTRFRRLAIALVIVASGASLLYPATARAVGFRRHLVAGGLNNPAAFTFTPRGNIFYGERGTGEIRIYNPAHHTNRPFFKVPRVVNGVAAGTEQGLLGIALHPNYPKAPFVYAYATRNVNGSLRDQIVRIRNSGGHGTGMTVIVSSRTTSGSYHDGGRILFGPDGMLYAVQGEAHHSANSQNLHNTAGKILRMTPAGKPAPGNPFIGSSTRARRIWAFGIRNSFGFAFDPRTNRLWETENGPECNDELNRIVKGGNFGWGPNENCSGTSPGDTNNSGSRPRRFPKRWYTPTIAPTGGAFCRRCHLGPNSGGRLFFGAFNTGQIRRVTLTSNRLGVKSQSVVYTNSEGVLSMERAPGGGIYFSDSSHIYKLVHA
jgi:quinoprotein glucose dehydrogenase